MVHYIRFLKTARVVTRSSNSVSVRALVTITTDLGDTFLLSDVILTSFLVSADDTGRVLCKAEKRWQGGFRELTIDLTAPVSEACPLLRLCTAHVTVSDTMPSILEAWSAPFGPFSDSPAAPVVERQLSLPNKASIKIWEMTGDSIARHIWDASLGFLLYLQDLLSANTRLPNLLDALRKGASGQINILELGAGCGIVGIAIAHCFPNCLVQLTDLVEAQDILSRNTEQATPAKGSSLQHWTLDWNKSDEIRLARDLDLIIVSDCTYNPDSCPNLVRTLAGLCSIAPEVTVLIAMKRRHESESVFFDLMERAHMRELAQTTIELPHNFSTLDFEQPEVELYLFRWAGEPSTQ